MNEPIISSTPSSSEGRPDTTDPEVVSQHVLSRFTEPASEVRRLIERAADVTERLLEREYAASREPA